MPKLAVKIPSYRLHKPSGRAVVTIDGRHVYLGKHGTPESEAEYHRVIAEWQTNRHQRAAAGPASAGPSIDEIILAYTEHARKYYRKPDGRPTSEVNTLAQALRPLHELYGQTDPAAFGPLALKTVRQRMIERNWCRRQINQQCSRIKQMFKWAAENEMISAEIYHRLQTVAGLRRGRCDARESEPVRPVAEEHIEATLPHVSPQVAAMIQLQLLTGMRPGEVTAMRGCDLDMSGATWTYTPATHKTQHHGKQRIIYLGPKAKAVLQPHLKHDLSAYLFSPIEAEAQRLAKRHELRITPLSCGNRPGTNRTRSPKLKPQEHYTVNSYRRAIDRGCEKAFPPPEHLQPKVFKSGKRETKRAFLARLGDKEKAELKAWHQEHRWHPHQLRHTAATRLRKQFGIEAARVVLGHSSAAITEIYAEVDREKASQIMCRVG